MRLYNTTDSYIKYLQQFDNKVLSNHQKTHNRPYIGLGLSLNNHFYFIPLSSPDNMDFKNGEPRKSTFTIIRLFDKNKILGKVLINNMIPIPESELIEYNPQMEQDIFYKNLISKDLRELKKVESKIYKNAKQLYIQKYDEKFKDKGYIKATVDFKKLEIAKAKYAEYKIENKIPCIEDVTESEIEDFPRQNLDKPKEVNLGK